MTFEEYLISKKIDARAFKATEPELYQSWHIEFDQMHPNSFTVQKLYLINPIRIKYTLTLKQEDLKSAQSISDVKVNSIALLDNQKQPVTPSEAKPEVNTPQVPKPARPVFKSKPKTN